MKVRRTNWFNKGEIWEVVDFFPGFGLLSSGVIALLKDNEGNLDYASVLNLEVLNLNKYNKINKNE